MDCFQLADNHNDLNEKIGPQLLEVPNVLIIDFGPIEVGGVEQMHCVFLDKFNEEEPAVFLLKVSELFVAVQFFRQDFPLLNMGFEFSRAHHGSRLFNQNLNVFNGLFGQGFADRTNLSLNYLFCL